MKIGITGHSYGLGKSLFDYFQQKGHNCYGYSRTNGYDINKDFDSIVGQVKEFDLFINNATESNIQSKFVNYLSSYSVDIVSMGTASANNYISRQDSYSGWKKDYMLNKYLLLEEHKAKMYSSKGKLLLLNLEALENHPTSEHTIKFSEVYDMIDFWLVHKNLSIVNYSINTN